MSHPIGLGQPDAVYPKANTRNLKPAQALQNGFRADQVQNFYPSPMTTATAMYYSGKNPLKRLRRDSETVETAKGDKQHRLHKAFMRYHDPTNWPLLREALQAMGRDDLIGNGRQQLVPAFQPRGNADDRSPPRKKSNRRKRPGRGRILTQHTGLPPRG